MVDQSGASIPKAVVHLTNAVSGYSQSVATASDGSFRLVNIPANPYHLEVTAPGFGAFAQDVTIRNSIPVQVKATLAVAGTSTSVTVEAASADILENDPSAHIDVDRNLILKLPASDPGGGLSQAIIYSTGGVAADANGFFHPLGDHAPLDKATLKQITESFVVMTEKDAVKWPNSGTQSPWVAVRDTQLDPRLIDWLIKKIKS